MSHIANMWKTDIDTNQENNVDCCGCSACENKCPVKAIKMKYDGEGFLYPLVDEKTCIDCGLCTKVCPIANSANINEPYLKTYAGYATDDSLLMNCTSGGFITALSLKIIKQGGLVAGVRYQNGCIKSEYYLGSTKEDVLQFSSSKYVQSEKSDVYRKIEQGIKQGKTILFVGCPCDVYALKRFLGKEHDNLLTCELVCMGVSSYRIAEEYKKYVERKYHDKLVKINTRSKKKGWFVPHLEEVYDTHRVRCNTLYGTYLGYGMQVYNRPSCFSCKFRGTNGAGDIRVGDFWGIKESDPYWNLNGVSCVFVRTQAGMKAFELLNSDEFVLFETDYETATLSNMSSRSNKPEKYVALRKRFADTFQKDGLIAACRATGTISFWTKHFVPDVFHSGIKRFYHFFVDKR